MLIRSLLAFFLLYSLAEISAQSIQLEGDAIRHQRGESNMTYDRVAYGGGAHITLSYSDTLKRKWDYLVGLGYLESSQWYAQDIDVPSRLDTSSSRVLTIGPRYNNAYVMLALGARYWFAEKRKGLYFQSRLMPHFLLNSHSRNWTYNEDENRQELIESNSKDDFNSFNLLLQNGIGYRIDLLYGLSFHFGLNTVAKIEEVIEGMDEGVKINIGLNVGGAYKF